MNQSIAVILAAGKGTRMKSDLAKVLFPLAGRPLIHHVLDAVEASGIFERSVVIVGHQHQRVKEELAGRKVDFALQEPQLGTGHAMQCAAPLLRSFSGAVVVLAGDVPLIRKETLTGLMEHHHETGASVTILTANVPDAAGYGRIVRDATGAVTAIVEEKDAGPEIRKIREINSSIYAFDYPFLEAALPRLENKNRQGEYYLTDTVAMAVEEGRRVEGIPAEDFRELSGINTVEQLEELERVMGGRT